MSQNVDLEKLAVQLTELKEGSTVKLTAEISLLIPPLESMFREDVSSQDMDNFNELLKYDGNLQISRRKDSKLKILYTNKQSFDLFLQVIESWETTDNEVYARGSISIPDYMTVEATSKVLIKPKYQIDIGQYGLRHLKNVHANQGILGLEEEELSDIQIIEFFKNQGESTEHITKYLAKAGWKAERVLNAEIEWGIPHEEVTSSIDLYINTTPKSKE